MRVFVFPQPTSTSGGFDPFHAAASLLDPELASSILTPEMASLMHSPRILKERSQVK